MSCACRCNLTVVQEHWPESQNIWFEILDLSITICDLGPITKTLLTSDSMSIKGES